MNSKGTIGDHELIIFWNLLEILSCRRRVKIKKVFDFFTGSLETYTWYSQVADEDQKKRVLVVFE